MTALSTADCVSATIEAVSIDELTVMVGSITLSREIESEKERIGAVGFSIRFHAIFLAQNLSTLSLGEPSAQPSFAHDCLVQSHLCCGEIPKLCCCNNPFDPVINAPLKAILVCFCDFFYSHITPYTHFCQMCDSSASDTVEAAVEVPITNGTKQGLRVLFLSSDTGGGHRASAEALAKQFQLLFPGTTYDLLDVVEKDGVPRIIRWYPTTNTSALIPLNGSWCTAYPIAELLKCLPMRTSSSCANEPSASPSVATHRMWLLAFTLS